MKRPARFKPYKGPMDYKRRDLLNLVAIAAAFAVVVLIASLFLWG